MVRRPTSNGEYTQLGIGDCGHIVELWPMVTDFGGKNPRVICDDCTRIHYGIDNGDQFFIVKVVEKKDQSNRKPPPKKRAPRAPKPKTGFAALLEREGL